MSNPAGNVSGSSLFQILTGGSSSSPSASPDLFSLDSISTSNPFSNIITPVNANSPSLPMPTSDVDSLLQYSKVLNDARNQFQSQQNTFQTLQVGLDTAMWAGLADQVQGLANIRSQMATQAVQEENLRDTAVSQTTDYNAAVAAYDADLTAASSTSIAMYDQQLAYISGTITTAQYNAQVANWNNTVPAQNAQLQTDYDAYSAAVATYNSQIAANNATIQSLNAARAASGITAMIPLETPVSLASLSQLPVPLADGPPPPATPTVPISFPTISPETGNTATSTAIDVTPLNAQEQAFVDGLKNDIDQINNNGEASYNYYLATTQSFVNTFQQAVLDYQNGTITTAQYNAAVQTYNTDAANANTNSLNIAGSNYIDAVKSYNQGLTSINAQITAFNTVRAENNETLIPLQTPLPVPTIASLLLPVNIPLGPPPPATNPLSSAPIPIIPQVPTGSSTPTNTASYLNTYYLPLYTAAMNALDAFQQKLTLQDTYRDFQVFTLPGKNKLLPNNAYIDKYPDVFFSSNGPASTVSGVGLTLSVVGIDNQSLNAILTNALLTATNRGAQEKEANTLVPQTAIEKMALFSVLALQKAALEATLPTLATIGNKQDPETLSSNAARTTLALTNLNVIQNLVKSGAIDKVTSQFLADANLSPEQAQAAAETLSAATSAGLLQFGLALFARAAQLPGLLPQALGNLSGTDIQQQLVSSAGNTLQNIVTNPVTVLSLKDSLSKTLTSQLNISTDQAQTKANNIVNNTLNTAGALDSNNSFRTGIIRSSQNEGLVSGTSIKLADQASNILKSEQTVQDLGASFNVQAFTQKSSSIQNLLTSSASQDAYASALATASSNNFETRREFLNEFVDQLQQRGVNSSSATDLANNVLLATQSPDQRNAFNVSNINQDLLLSSLHSNANGAANPTAVTASVAATIAAGPPTDAAFRASLYDNFVQNGFSSHSSSDLANTAAIAVSGNDPLKSPVAGDFLNRQALSEQITENVTKQLKGSFGTPLASTIANQAALTIVGNTSTRTPETNEVVHQDVQSPTSWLNLANDAYVRFQKNNAKEYADLVAENSRDLRNPLVSTIDLQNRILDPGHNFMKATGVMYKGMGREPDNFKNEISIQI